MGEAGVFQAKETNCMCRDPGWQAWYIYFASKLWNKLVFVDSFENLFSIALFLWRNYLPLREFLELWNFRTLELRKF